MTQDALLTDAFEEHRRHLFGVAYRMLGSVADAEDAVQEAWLRLRRHHDGGGERIESPGAWLTTAVSRIALNVLRSRSTHRTDSLEERLEHLPEPVVQQEGAGDPGEDIALADGVGIALLVVLGTLTPAERVAFVLHDLFSVPFAQIAEILDVAPDAARQHASRARRRVRGQGRPVEADADPARQREVVEAFFAAARDGDLPRLIGVLHPEVVVLQDTGTRLLGRAGAQEVAASATTYAHPDRRVLPVLVNGAAAAAIVQGGTLRSIMAFTVAEGRITEIDAYMAPAGLARWADALGIAAGPGGGPAAG